MRYVPETGFNKIWELNEILESIYCTLLFMDNDIKLPLEKSKIEIDLVFFSHNSSNRIKICLSSLCYNRFSEYDNNS